MRTCNVCFEDKPLTDYYKTSKGGYHGKCKVCYKLKQTRPSPESRKEYYLQRAFGMSLEDYSEKLEAQGGVCGICGSHPPENRKKYLAVDHCHESGEIRGLLCDNCNRGLGLLGDNISSLQKAIEYLSANS